MIQRKEQMVIICSCEVNIMDSYQWEQFQDWKDEVDEKLNSIMDNLGLSEEDKEDDTEDENEEVSKKDKKRTEVEEEDGDKADSDGEEDDDDDD